MASAKTKTQPTSAADIADRAKDMTKEFAFQSDDFADMITLDDGSGFSFAVMEPGKLIRGVAVSTEESQFGESVVFRSASPIKASTKDEEQNKVVVVHPPGALIRLSRRKALDKLFDMVDAGVQTPFQIKPVSKMEFDDNTVPEGTRSYWRIQVAIDQKALAKYGAVKASVR